MLNGIEIKNLLMAHELANLNTLTTRPKTREEDFSSIETLHTHVICVHTFSKFAIKRKKRVFKYIGITLDDNYFQH